MEPRNEHIPAANAPELSERSNSQERAIESKSEKTGDIPSVPSPEQAPEYSESREPGAGENTGANQAGATAQQIALPSINVILAPIAADPANDDNPLAADDVDVIEKEWVDRAKKVLQSTKDDPYQKEQEVSKLQADYLQKRFGVQVKLPQG